MNSFRLLPALLASLAAGVALQAAPNVELVPTAGDIAAYDFAEATLNVTGSEAKNPFTDVAVTGSFGLKGATPVAVDGFCDSADGRTFRIRFMPAKPGAYEYRIKYHEGGFEQTLTGSFTATDDKRKGVLRIDPEFPAHFQWEGTKERLFWNGATAFGLAGWDTANIAQIVERFDLAKITRLRVALAGATDDTAALGATVSPNPAFNSRLAPWVASQSSYDVTRFDVAYWQQWERLLQETRRRDMIVSVVFYAGGTDPFGAAGQGGADEQRYFRYAVARLGAFANVTWDLARAYQTFRNNAWADKMGTFLKECDPYHHLASVQGDAEFQFRRTRWADYALHASADEKGGFDFIRSCRAAQDQTGRTMPQINEDYGYEDFYPQGANLQSPARDATSRIRLAWQIALAGGYQTTGERAAPAGGWLNGGSDEANVLLEPYGHLFDFFTGITWWRLQPEPALVAAIKPHPSAPAGTTPRAFAARAPEADLAAIYIQGGGIVTLKGELLKDQLKPLWFSPRDGGMRNARPLRDRIFRTPTADDWVLLYRTPCNCSFRDFDNEFER
jgi:hypothetical protein